MNMIITLLGVQKHETKNLYYSSIMYAFIWKQKLGNEGKRQNQSYSHWNEIPEMNSAIHLDVLQKKWRWT